MSRGYPKTAGPQIRETNMNYKICFSISMAVFGLASIGSAATMNCTPSSVTVGTTAASYGGGSLFYPGPTTGGGPIVCGNVTFSDFQVFDAAMPTSTGAPFVLLSGTYTDSTTTLSFNPNLNNASVNQDIHLLFSVSSTSAILSVGLSNGGSLASGISERLCSGAIDPFSGVCSGGTTLTTVTAAGGATVLGVLSTPSTTFQVYKDIGHPAGGEITGFSQTFTAGAVSAADSKVPEPATFAMLGGGLTFLALIRRKKVA